MNGDIPPIISMIGARTSPAPLVIMPIEVITAKLANIKIVGTNTISDIEPTQEYSRSNGIYESDSISGSAEETNLPNGKKIVLESKVFVVFDIGKK